MALIKDLKLNVALDSFLTNQTIPKNQIKNYKRERDERKNDKFDHKLIVKLRRKISKREKME